MLPPWRKLSILDFYEYENEKNYNDVSLIVINFHGMYILYECK
jgi:hypothetical protein